MSQTEAAERPPRRLTESQVQAILNLPNNGEVVICTDEATRPVEHYTSEAHFQRELHGLFHHMAIPLTVSGMLPKPNTAYAHDGFGIPILLMRDRDGVARAFLNVCTHRGAKIVEETEPHACGGRVTCPFHAWTFAADGRLIGLPEPESFPTLDRSRKGLRQLACRESAGIIWVGLNPDIEPDFSHIGDELAADLEAFGLPDMKVYKRKTFDLPANWKLIVEPFFEGYHVRPLHKNTVGKEFSAVQPIQIDRLDGGPNTRQTVGRGGFSREDVDLDLRQLRKVLTHNYNLFPTAMLVTSPYHYNFITIMPRAAGRTVVECYMLVEELPTTEKAIDLFDRSFEFNFTTVFGNEDFRAATLVQTGLMTGALKEVSFGGLEQLAVAYHREVEARLAE